MPGLKNEPFYIQHTCWNGQSLPCTTCSPFKWIRVATVDSYWYLNDHKRKNSVINRICHGNPWSWKDILIAQGLVCYRHDPPMAQILYIMIFHDISLCLWDDIISAHSVPFTSSVGPHSSFTLTFSCLYKPWGVRSPITWNTGRHFSQMY